MTDQQTLLDVLRTVVLPDLGQDLVTAGVVKQLTVTPEGAVSLQISLGFPAASLKAALTAQLQALIRQQPGVSSVTVSVGHRIVPHAVQRGNELIPGVKNIIAVASGKGGVGKSTTAVNLALALAAEGARVGILDADVYGPSMPTMLGVSGRPETHDGKLMEPLQAHGVQVNSIGFLVGLDQPVIWRGPMVSQALDQLLRETRWDDLDYLVMDLPPGTGDVHLSLAQKVPITGAVIVTTPQEIALLDARKGLKMFEKVSVPVVGIVENMSVYICPSCGHQERLFGEGGGQLMATDYSVPLLGHLPLDLRIRERADSGVPILVAEPEGEIAEAYRQIARRVAIALSRIPKDYSHKMPGVVVKGVA